MMRILALLLALVALVFWVRMIVDAVTNKGVSDTERLMWVLLVILLTPGLPLGALIYFFYGRPKRRLAA
jgi:drug/metabolite transporter (DMT)-like permease